MATESDNVLQKNFYSNFIFNIHKKFLTKLLFMSKKKLLAMSRGDGWSNQSWWIETPRHREILLHGMAMLAIPGWVSGGVGGFPVFRRFWENPRNREKREKSKKSLFSGFFKKPGFFDPCVI